MRVLILDDDAVFLQVACEYLSSRDEGAVIDPLTDPEQAVAVVRSVDYDVIVTDLRMPGLNGMEFLSECRRWRPNTPVIFVSGYGDADFAETAARNGAYAFLHKPVDPDAFYSVVKRAALRSTLRRRPEKVFADTSAWPSPERIQARLDQLRSRLRAVLPEKERR